VALLDKVRKEKRLPTLALACWNVCHGIPVIPAVCLTHALQLLCGSTRAAAHLATAPKHANETATKSSRHMLQPLRLPPAPEQEHFPRDKICGDAVCTPAIHILEASRSAGAASWEGRLRLADRWAVAAAAAARLRLCRSQDCSWCRRLPAQALLPHPGLLLMHALQTSFIGHFLFLQEMGVTEELTAKNNEQTIDQTINALNADSRGLIFSNLVDFDMLYGHRRDTEGYAKALEHFDERLPEILDALNDSDLLIMTADHGNDPTKDGSDHTREYVPLLVYGRSAKAGVNLGTRQSLSDIGQTIAENFGLELSDGVSFLNEI